MAKNRLYATGKDLSLPVPSGTVSGDPVVIGNMPGVALVDRGAHTAGEATVEMRGVFLLSVEAENDSGVTTIAVGAPVFYTSGDTPKLNAKSSGKLFGFALTAIGSGLTATIPVKLAETGDGRVFSETTINAGAITATEIAAGAVTKAKLAGGFLKQTIVAGTNAAADVTVAAIAVGDELVSVFSLATAAAIATIADRTSEYVVAAGKLTKAAGTDDRNNALLITYLDLTA